MKAPAEWVALAVFLVGAALALASAPVALARSASEASVASLRRAFDRTFQQPGVRRIELRVLRGERLVARRHLELAHRREAQGSRTLVRFLAPDYLRDHALLIVESEQGDSDTWLYQPEERRARRVGSAQKGDSFYGTDVTLEDLERARWERWRIVEAGAAEEAGEACRVLDAWPPADSQYGRLRVWIATRIDGVLRIDFFGRRASAEDATPLKRLRVDLAGAQEERGFLRLARIDVETLGRDARTELTIERMAIEAALPASLFSTARLEREGEDLFALAERHRRESER